MKLIMRTEFKNLQNNPLHGYQSDVNGEKQIVKLYRDEYLIAKQITLKKSIRYFAVDGYQQFLTNETE
jgi:hypothetical protein